MFDLSYELLISAFFLFSLLYIFQIIIIRKTKKIVSLKNEIKQKDKNYDKSFEKYKDIIDIDKIITQREKTIIKKDEAIEKLLKKYSAIKEKFGKNYIENKTVFDKLLYELQIIEEDFEIKSYGLYNPHYNFDTSEEYKNNIEKTRKEQKETIRSKEAAICYTNWTIDGSRREGKKQTNQYIKLMLRAFNGESDSTILKVRWNNIIKMEERLKKTFEMINRLGLAQNISITEKYLTLKLSELRLAYEYQEKKQQEKEEQKRIREELREEERVQKEVEKTLKDVEKEEGEYNAALEKVKKEIETANEVEMISLNRKITELQKQLTEANEKKERAISRAQLTKSGHVYIISNIGSFGENIYKIGMTRRLEPLDRVKELGDASVPFLFDVHAMIFSENAPGLENTLHKVFESSRVNLVNTRKEFYKVTMEEIEKVVNENFNDVEFIKYAEARQYRETTALLEKVEEKKEMFSKYNFPDKLYDN